MSEVVYEKSRGLTDAELTYCPGCTHGIIHKLVAESLVELGVLEKTIILAPVGCSVMLFEFFNCDCVQAAHGRAPAIATGIKRTNPDKIVVTYQGDGDLAAIGTAEVVHAAHRGENISIVFVNNAIFGMTGGQMAPTTLPGQKTTTSADGRDISRTGQPIRMAEMLSQVPSAYYIERVAVNDIPNIRKAKAAVKKAIQNQIDGKGFSLVEVLGTCNIGWNMSPVDAMAFVKNSMIPYYPLGCYKDGGAK